MGPWVGWNCFDFRDAKNAEICLPLMESIQRVMVRTEVFGQTVPGNGPVEHPAQCHSMNGAAVDAEPNDATGELVHHYENPMSSQRSRFATE